MRLKRWILALLTVGIVLTATACDPIPGFSGTDETAVTPGGGETLTDGRQVGGIADGRLGDQMGTAWFNFSVDNAKTTSEYGGYRPYDGYTLLVVSITLKNTFGSSVPMSLYDFELFWEDDYLYGIGESEMSDNFVLEKGQSLTQDIVYEVPSYIIGEYYIIFTEYYENDDYGNTFVVTLDRNDIQTLDTSL